MSIYQARNYLGIFTTDLQMMANLNLRLMFISARLRVGRLALTHASFFIGAACATRYSRTNISFKIELLLDVIEEEKKRHETSSMTSVV
jgi:hypothetical protein